MKEPSPYQQLIDLLATDGLATPSKKLNFLLTEILWTHTSEFLGGFGSEMEKIKHTYWDRMSQPTQTAFSVVAKIIQRTWPDMIL